MYDGAVYMWGGRPHICSKLDLSARVALVRPADVKYYTRVRDVTDVHVTGGGVAYAPSSAHVSAAQGATVGGGCPAGAGGKGREGDGGGGGRVEGGGSCQAGNVVVGQDQEPGHVPGAPAPTPTCGGSGCVGACGSSHHRPHPCCGQPHSAVQDPLPPPTSASCDAAAVTTRVLGFSRVWQASGRVFDVVDLWLPDVTYDTQVGVGGGVGGGEEWQGDR